MSEVIKKLKQAIVNYRVLRDSKYEWVQGMINIIEHLEKCDDIQMRLYWTMEDTLQKKDVYIEHLEDSLKNKEAFIENMEAQLKEIRAAWDKMNQPVGGRAR